MNPKFDLEGSENLLGKRVIVDTTIRNHDETLVEKRQLVGEIARINENEGIVLKLIPSGYGYHLIPDLDQLVPLAPGRYHLEPEGTVVENPEYFFSSVIHLPPPDYRASEPS